MVGCVQLIMPAADFHNDDQLTLKFAKQKKAAKKKTYFSLTHLMLRLLAFWYKAPTEEVPALKLQLFFVSSFLFVCCKFIWFVCSAFYGLKNLHEGFCFFSAVAASVA